MIRRLKKILTADELEYLLQKYKFMVKGNEIHCDLANVQTRIVKYKRDQRIILSFLNLPTDRKVYYISDLARELFFKYNGEKNLIILDQLLTKFIYYEKRNYEDISQEEFEKRYNEFLLEHFLIKGQTLK